MRFASVHLSIAVALLPTVWCGEAQAQPAPGSHFNRMTNDGGARARRGRAAPLQSSSVDRIATTRDLLTPYTSRPQAHSSSPAADPPPPKRRESSPVVRNYFPTARSGQVQRHCTPSRSGVLGPRR